MLIPFEIIAVILYLASISDQTAAPESFSEALLPVIIATGLCLFLVTLQTVILLKRDRFYTKRNRQFIWLCNSGNKILSCAATIFILQKYNLYNLFSLFLPAYAGNYILQNITGMLIFIEITLVTWIPWYYVHRRSSPGIWTFRSYLVHKFRYTFFILGIWLPGILLSEYLESADSIISSTQLGIFSTLFFLLIAWIFPLFLRKFWGCTPLQDTQLRRKIIQLTEKSGVRLKGIYLWSLGGKSVPNAAMVGFFPPFQYLFISHGLLNRLPEEEVLGVVAHELGHLKKHHILFYLLMSITILSTLEPFIFAIFRNSIYTIVCMVGIFFLYIRFIFAWFSRRFEREADLFSAELLKDFRPLSRGLERIGLACGNIRNEASWHHYGIAERVWFLQESYYNGVFRKNFKQRIKYLRLAAILLFCFMLGNTAYSFLTSTEPPAVRTHQYTRVKSDLRKNMHNWQEINAILGQDSIFRQDPSNASQQSRNDPAL